MPLIILSKIFKASLRNGYLVLVGSKLKKSSCPKIAFPRRLTRLSLNWAVMVSIKSEVRFGGNGEGRVAH